MSFAIDRRGNAVVLDQVNRRLQRFDRDGRFLSAQTIETATAQDIALDEYGRALVLDRLGRDPAITIYDDSGKKVGAIPLASETIGRPGGISGVFADGDGIYVEVGHDKVVRVADGAGQPISTEDTVPGRPTRDGKLFIKAGMLDKSAGRLYVQAHGKDHKLVWETALDLGAAILHILLLDSDKAGNVYIGVEAQDAPGQPPTYKTPVARLEGTKGKLTGQMILPPTTADPSESFRPLSVGDDGTIYHLVHGANGPTITSYRFE